MTARFSLTLFALILSSVSLAKTEDVARAKSESVAHATVEQGFVEESVRSWPKVMVEMGSIPAKSQIRVRKLDASKDVLFRETGDAQTKSYRVTDPSGYVQVQSVKTPETATATATAEGDAQLNLQQSAADGDLLVPQEQLTNNATCVPEGDTSVCQTINEMPAVVNSRTNPAVLKDAMGTSAMPYMYPQTAAVAPTAETSTGINSGMAPMLLAGLAPLLGKLNTSATNGSNTCDDWSTGGSGSSPSNPGVSEPEPTSGVNSKDIPAMARSDGKRPPECAVHLAQEAKKNAGGLVKSDVMVVWDNVTTQSPGQMWFVKSDGSLADVGVPNPIPATHGQGGFGIGCGSNKTPEGAMVTAHHHQGNTVRDGVWLEGLEPGNRKDLAQGCGGSPRGAVLHAWNPNGKTHGCIGISGAWINRSGNKQQLGAGGDYYTTLKRNLFLNDGGKVLIYNFTPSRTRGCSQAIDTKTKVTQLFPR